ncbi:peptidoglycan endopeptidase [Candidatus Dojkabacteria bacterium]|uniref:Peptidoglycan endopeptidase n=1 Tax=Candidatus Dojkabacteria bacterium TaxID=2099670 RepID=A0A5C7J8N2_9BACT|nr:MAG: peptidoglycan endopeptidase [Candidatus Dojkabacteria bacterium]
MELLKEYALSFIGVPYRWGGDDAILGYDCSGFIQELLKSCGEDPPEDQTAQKLYDHFEKKGRWNSLGLGALAFYGKDTTKISHVAMMLDGYRIIEAGGGGSTTIDLNAAAAQNAFIRVRLLKERKDLVAIIKPYYHAIGMI